MAEGGDTSPCLTVAFKYPSTFSTEQYVKNGKVQVFFTFGILILPFVVCKGKTNY